jgi:hypothetical protein
MMSSTTRLGIFAVAATLVAATACGRTAADTDESLKRDLAAATTSGGDLELAPSGARTQAVISAIEAGPTAAPKRASTAKSITPAPVRRQTQPRPQKTATAAIEAAAEPAQAPAPGNAEPAPAPAPTVEPPPLPPAAKGPSSRQQGTYKTEAEIFRQMPWIRP